MLGRLSILPNGLRRMKPCQILVIGGAFIFWRAAMYMPEMDLTKHIQLKEVLRQEALKAMDQMIEMQQLESAGNDFKPFTQRNDIKPATTKTMKNRQKRLRKKK